MVHTQSPPRHICTHSAFQGEGDHTWADEQNVLAAQAVFDLLGVSDHLHIRFRPGRHHGFIDPAHYVDWFDFAGAPPQSAAAAALAPLFPDSHTKPLPHAFDWAAWNRSQSAVGAATSPPPPSAPLLDRVNWLIGGTAAGSTAGLIGGSAYCESGAIGSEWDFKAALMMHDSFPRCEGRGCASNVTRISLSFGGYITASLFVPCATARCEEITAPLPVVVFLHGYSYQLGFTGIYGLYKSWEDGGLINAVVSKHRVAVLAFDMTGHGARQDVRQPRHHFGSVSRAASCSMTLYTRRVLCSTSCPC